MPKDSIKGYSQGSRIKRLTICAHLIGHPSVLKHYTFLTWTVPLKYFLGFTLLPALN